MGTPSTLRPNRKRPSPRASDLIDDATDILKRRRSDPIDKENQQEQMRTQMEVETEDSTEPESDAVAAHMAGRNVNQAGKPPEAGVIKSIYCENFMCHRKLTVDLCRNVNFIYGQNGSGKSAVLAAIQICLGAKAGRTHRARNLKELVRKDAACNNAKIRVTLLNGGMDGYHHEIYGNTITVERTIAVRGGYNGYKLYDEHMKEQSRSKKDLDDMLDKLNIQVENPVAILDQEEAKKFLTGKSEDKYNFFMKATELERIDRSYETLLTQKEELDSQSCRMRASLQADVELVAETKKKYEQHKEISKMEDKLRGYEEGFAWAMHGEANAVLEEELDKQAKFREKATKKREELSQAEEQANAPDEVEQAKRNRLEELTNEAQEQSRTKQDLEADLKRAVEPQKAAERQMKHLQRAQKQAKSQLQKATHRLQEKRDEIMAREGSAESEAAMRTQRLQEAESKYEAALGKRDELMQATSDSYRKYEELEPDVHQAKQNCATVQARLNAVDQKMKGLRSSTGNSLAMFGQRCSRVKQLVDKAVKNRRFTGPVVGPIGAYLKVAPGKEKFASLAELALGNGSLDRFIVTNDHDRKAFQAIRREAKCQNDCGIFQVSQHPKYNIPPPPVDGIETIASVLTISDDLVFNCLVDNCKIEERAISTSKDESERLLLRRGNDGQRFIAGKIKTVYFLPAGDSWAIRNGNIQMTANEKKLRQTIGVDKSAAIADAEQEAFVLQAEVDKLRKEESRLELKHLECQKSWNKAKRVEQTNNKEINALVVEIDSIKNEEVSAENLDTDTTEFEQEVQEAQDEVQNLSEQEKELKDSIATKNPEIGEIKARLNEARTRNEKVLRDISEAEDELAQHVHNLSQRQEKLEKKREKVKQYETIIEQQDQKVSAMQSDVDQYLDAARRLAFQRIKREERQVQEEEGDQPDDSQFTQDPTIEELASIEICNTEETASFFEAKIKRFKKKIQQEKERRNAEKDDPVIAYQKYRRARDQLRNKTKKCQEIEALSEMLEIDVKERKRRWKQFQVHIADLTDMKFDEMLNKKGSSGTIEFDHRDKQLNLIVQKDSRDSNSQQKDVKGLSGGERSYTTIALLLALGESLETPFRVLDEFDVFLDPVARKLTIESLIKMAKGMQHRQFIFITPQDVSNVETDPMLKVLKMTPPARNEIAGAPTQQTLEFASQP